jgi:hypothetical protein
MDLGARDCQVCVIDEDRSRLAPQQVRHERSGSLRLTDPAHVSLLIVVERPFHGYWLVDGLQEAGYDVCWAPTLGLYRITGAQGSTGRRDARAWATRRTAGMLPTAYSSPYDTRPMRALRRQRARLVTLRATEYGSLRRLLLRHGRLGHSRHAPEGTSEGDLQRWFEHPLVRLHGQHERQRMLCTPSRLPPSSLISWQPCRIAPNFTACSRSQALGRSWP